MNKYSANVARNQSRKARRFFLGLLLVLIAPGLVAAQATKVTSSEGRYTVIFPAPASREQSPEKTENGVTYGGESYVASLSSQIFVTHFTSYKGATVNTEKELKANVDNFLKGVSGALLQSKPTTFMPGNIAGIEFIGETDTHTFHGKFFVAGNDVWGILYGAQKTAVSEPMKEQFFRSFVIDRSSRKGEHQ